MIFLNISKVSSLDKNLLNLAEVGWGSNQHKSKNTQLPPKPTKQRRYHTNDRPNYRFIYKKTDREQRPRLLHPFAIDFHRLGCTHKSQPKFSDLL